MWPRYCHRLPCVFGVLVLLQLTISRSFQFPDSLSDKRNLPGESADVYNRGAIRDGKPPTSSRPPGCCTPELHLGFDNATTDLVDDNHDIRRAHSRVVSIADAPCGNFANLNVEVVQFKSAKFAKVTDAITISVWVNLQNISGIQPILYIKGETGELRFEITQGHVSWLSFVKSPSRATFALLSPNPVVVPYMWTHMVAQYDTRRNRASVFVNGKEILQGVSNGEPLEIAWSEFTTIGEHSISEALEFKLSGYVDEFYIYYCALPEMVIQKLYQMCHIDSQCAPIRQDGFCGPDDQPYAVQERCVPCFCMGRSQSCSSANLYRDRLEMQVKNESTRLVDENGSDVSGITYTADHLSNALVAYNVSKRTRYYWTLPKKLLGNKLSSYGGKLRYTVRYHSGNKIRDRSVKNTSRYLRSLREILNSRGFVANYNIRDVRDEETSDIDASGIDDPSLGDLDEVTSAPNTPSPNSRVTGVTEGTTNSASLSTEISKERFGSIIESQETVHQVNSSKHFTKNPTTPVHTVVSSSKKPTTPQQPTIDGKEIFTTGKIASMATVSPEEDFELVINQDNKNTGRVRSTAAPKPEPPTTAASTATTTKSVMSSTAKDAFTNGEDDARTFLLSSGSNSDGPTSETTAETTSTIPDASFTASGAFTDGKDEETRFVSSSAYSASPESEAMTTTPETSSLIWDEPTDVQDEINITYTTKTLILKVQVPDTFQPTSNTVTDGQSESTTFQPTSAYSTIPVTSIDGQDETTTPEPFSAHSIEKPTSDTVATIPSTYYVATDTDRGHYATTTFAASSVYTTERPPETVTTIPDLLHTLRGTLASAQDKTTFAEPSSAHSTDRATSDPVTTIPDTFPATTDSPGDGEDETKTTKPFSAQPTKRTPSDTVTTIPNTHYTTTDTSTDVEDAETTFVVPPSIFSTDRPTSDPVRTIPDTFPATTDSPGDGVDETKTTKPSIAKSTKRTPSDTVTTIPNTHYTTTDTSTDGEDAETTFVVPSSAHSTNRATSDPVTAMPNTSLAATDSPSDGEDETKTTKPSSAQPTKRTPSDTVTTIPNTHYTTTDTSTDGKDVETTFVVPSSVFNTEIHTSDKGTTVPDKRFTTTDTSTISGQDKITTTDLLSAYSTETSTFPTRTTIPHTLHTTTDAFPDNQDETTPTEYPSVYSSEKLTSETVTTIPDTFYTTIEASTDNEGEKTTFSPSLAYVTERPTSEIATSVPATSFPVRSSTDGRDKTSTTESLPVYSTDKLTIPKETTIPDMLRTTKDAFTEGQGETTTADHSLVYSTEKPTSETLTTMPETFHTTTEASTDDQNEKNTFVPSSAYSTEKATSEVTSVPASSSPVSSSTDGRDDASTTGPPPVYNTPTLTIPPETTIPGTFYTTKDAFTDSGDETTTAEHPSAYNTNVPSSRTVTTTTSTQRKTDAVADNRDDTTTPQPPSAYSTDKPTSGAATTKLNTLHTTSVTSTDGDDDTTAEPPSAYTIDEPTSGAVTTQSPDTLYTTTDTSTDSDSEITTTEPFPSYSTKKHLSETMTTMISTSSVATTTRPRNMATSEVTTSDVTTTTAAVTQTTPGQVTEAVRLVGKQGTLVFYPEEPPNTNGYQTTVEVSLTEAKWRLSDGQPPSRDNFMSVLSEVQAIYVRALYGDGSSATSLSIKDISLDVVSPHNMGFGKALLVEQCECPVGYSGLSCEYCSPGYTRSNDGPSCTKCSCNEHSDICDLEKGTCLDCRHNTEGLHCDRCQSGYFGNALEGTPTDCQPCPCPLTIAPNQFSPTCFVDDDGLPTCDACPEGYTGRNCELCSVNFTGNPMIHHSKCELATELADSELRTCDSRGSLNFEADNRAQKCFCKSNVGGESCGTCKPGFFNLQADNPQGCTPCFCNGVSDSCQSALLNRTQIWSTFSENKLSNFTLVTLELSPVNSSELFINPLTKDLTFQSFVVEGVQNKILFWKLPQEYSGNKVTSYGGNLSHMISFVASSDGQPISAPDIVLVGKDITLYHFKETSSENNEEYAYQVKLYEHSWIDSNGQGISRDQFIMVLHKVEAILIRASYNTQMLQTTLREVSMDIAINDVTNQSRVTSVEQCACPLEYQGFSCESCTPGYYRSHVEPYLGKCIKCHCHGHSRDNYCDPETGECQKNCQHNTGGFRCQNCLTGFYGNATIGKPSDCKPCPCPMTSPPNRFSPTCFLAEDGQPTCDACPPGYSGRRCDRCILPYVGNPTEPGGNCKLEVDCGCNVRGSLNNSCDPLTRQCFCKKHVEGRTCDKCKRSFFNLQSDEPEGCVPCFCFGLTNDCKCANYYKDTIRLRVALIDGPNFLRLSDLSRNTIIGSGFQVEGDPGHYVYDKFDELPKATYYWFLGEEFRGDMVTSYDGILRYTVSHEMKPGGELTTDTDVELRGRGIVLIFRHRRQLEGGKEGAFGLKLSEGWLRYPDGSRVTRDIVMTVLSAVNSILVRATYSTTTTKASLYAVSLERGVPQETRFEKAEKIEDCSCPPEYSGTSCQRCGRGYTRSDTGPDFSPCIACSCNQHSKECDPERGQCRGCSHNTTGSQCERCAFGFYGDATQGTPKDCQPCPCPLTIASNQFSRTCKVESDGKPTCTACQTGYSGRTCNRCAKGYAGDPTKPGQKCVKLPAGFMPTVKIRPTKRIKTEGEDATFYCFPGGKGLPRTTWSRQNGKPLSSRAVVSGKTLFIRRVRKEDEGTYECTARNAYGFDTATSQLTVKALRVDPITVSVSPKVLRVPLNQTAQFTCRAKSTTDYQLKWTRGMYGALPEGAESEGGVLTIKFTRSIHGGTYTCTGKNAFNEDMVTVQLRVGVTRPQVFVSPGSLSVREGDSAQFRCSASGFPAPVLQWHGGPGGRLPPEAQSSNGNGLLTFDAVKKIHEGEYFCTASNLGGISSTGSFLIVSAPGSAPVISVTPITLTVLEGEQALFECTAGGDPTPTIRWSRENGRLPQFSSSENGLLNIFPTNLEDGGAYVCTAANAIGADGVLVTLTVERDNSVPPTAVISPTNQTVDEGASVFLTCQVSGDPLPSIKWKKVGDELTDNHVIINGLLQIQEATKEDEGMYVCIAQNKKGVKQATSIVNVRSQVMPKIEIMPAKKLTVTGGDTVVFRCVVKAGNPPPAVVWETEENKPLNSSSDGVLVISPASGDSQGKYICKASNVMGSTEAVALLIVQGEPNIIVSPSSPVSVTAGSKVILECAAAGDPPPSVQWIAPEDSRSNIQQVESRPGLFKLIIEDARPNDQGSYTCQARNLVGTARESVQLIVTVAHEAPEVAVVSAISETVIEGEKAEFRCKASGIPTPIITWERLGFDLPKGALARNGLLIIPSAGSEDAGTYICKAVNSGGEDTANVRLEVIVPPEVEVTPSQLSVNRGSSFRLFCLVRPPLPVKWSKVNGSIPSGSKQDKETLTADLVEVEHAGKYRCHASNAAGSSEGFTTVTVFVAPQVAVSPKALVASPGSNASFQCNASGIPDPVITWTKEGIILPRRHMVANDILTLTSLVGLDEGRYLCTATNAAGGSQKTVTLTVEDLPSVAITGGASVKTVSVGGSLTLECRGTGAPKPKIKWSRVGSSLPEGIVDEGRVLVITNAQHSHGGTYACNVTNRVGSVQSQVAIFVQEAPKVTVTPQKSRTKIGEPAELTCIASGSPSPQLTWRKLNSSLPVNSTVRDGVFRIANVTQQDAGIYFCEASNVEGTAVGNGTLEIKVTVPKFTHQPLSYLSLPTLTKEPLNFTVEIVFAPELANGLILYNDQFTKDSVGDFISFGMSDGFAEFRFNLGFEPAIIRSQQPLRRFEWHTVILSRDKKVGNLTVDGKPPVTGISKGGSTGLNLNQSLFVGGVPDFSSISSSSGFDSGFVGCLSYLVIDGKVAKLGDPINRVGLEDCDVCATRPCKNGGSCREVTGAWGFDCSCRPGYSGRTCQGAGQRCSPGVCNEGRCENVGEDGFKCTCPAGYSGERCEEGTLVDTPMFEGNSFMSFPGIEGAVQQLKLTIRFMVQKSGNMLLLYNGQRRYPKQGDFISLAVIGGKVVFMFNLGSGPGIVRSSRNITVGMWHTVLVERVRDRSSLTLDSHPPVTDYSPCCLKGLNLALDLFIGGVENFTVIDTQKVGVNTGLAGCISVVSVDDREINLVKSNLKLRDIKQCTECLLPCEIKPCLNNATCIPIGKTSYVCSCPQGYTGRHCEFTMVGPEKNKTCLNNGIAFPSSDRICACRLGYEGERCESFVLLGDSASFSGDGYLQFSGTLMRGPRVVKPDYMSLEIKTDALNGVILWQGQRRDHFAIGLREGFLEFRFELGSGPAVLLSSLPVNDGQWHTVEVFRSYREGSLKLDDSEPVNGTSVEGSLGLNIKGPILIGGGDNIVQTTYRRHQFIFC